MKIQLKTSIFEFMKIRENLIYKIGLYTLSIFYLYSATIILLNFDGFQIKLVQSELININFVDILKYIIPIINIATACLIFFEIKVIKALLFSLAFLFVVTVYLLALNEFSLFNGCNCGGIFDKLTYIQHILVNFIFISINLIMLFLTKKFK